MVVKKKADDVNAFLKDAKTVVATPINDEVSKSFLEYTMAVFIAARYLMRLMG
jgi:hypothetical protein